MNELISVIIPVYKVEKYLEGCLDSVASQTYKRLQIILVDDGSPDKSSEICDTYAKKDSRIKVIHKENGGAASARNAGLDIAEGKYLCFVDSDDSLPVDSVEVLYKAIKESGCAYAAGKLQNSSIGGSNVKCDGKYEIINLKSDTDKLLDYVCRGGSYSSCAKIFDLDIFRENNLKFDTYLKCAEDAILIRQYLKYCDSICVMPCAVYNQNTANANSISKRAYRQYLLYYAEKVRSLDELTAKLEVDVNKRNYFLTQRAIHGLKIGINHYLTYWNDEAEQKELLSKGVEALSPWLYLSELRKNDPLYGLRKYQTFLKEGKFDEFFKEAKKNYQKTVRMRKIRSVIKKCLFIK